MPTPRRWAASKPPADRFERIRAVCLALPEVTERLSHGEPAFFVRGKLFVSFWIDHRHDGEEAVWIKAAPGVQEALLDEDPEHFYRPPYVGVKGWVAARMDRRATPWDEVEALVREAWMLAAPRHLAATFATPRRG
ncbi:MAG: MmcQ/YjbR family DNA-binding protein [Dehalococcoidia bacterium]|nr:MAG: MmcQ/YjbR family DNA-binding protein [Dehalococcoidia bacterium]